MNQFMFFMRLEIEINILRIRCFIYPINNHHVYTGDISSKKSDLMRDEKKKQQFLYYKSIVEIDA